ncbi:MAG TPA: four helix bundle protein [Candidatus Magasanikbacteria bacterium]|nr:four helix bundle protein [Candidatus Magasanikbacteria bacterium]
MSQTNSKQYDYDLENRTFEFARRVRLLVKQLAKTAANIEDGKQLIRSSGSVGANYIEANESFSRKDFFMRIKICRKEAKESNYWLRLLEMQSAEKDYLTNEAKELTNIFGAIIRNAKF